jgi:hypothetical protein
MAGAAPAANVELPPRIAATPHNNNFDDHHVDDFIVSLSKIL